MKTRYMIYLPFPHPSPDADTGEWVTAATQVDTLRRAQEIRDAHQYGRARIYRTYPDRMYRDELVA